MDGLGHQLKMARSRWGLSLREVEERSLRLAERWGQPSYRISASWLHRVENEQRELSAAKLIVLASIYSLSTDELLGMSPAAKELPQMLEVGSAPNSTALLQNGPLLEKASDWLPDELITSSPPEWTGLLPAQSGALPQQYRRGVIGIRDKALDPMVPPGSFVLVDVSKRVIAGRRDWSNEFDRPIYFCLTRTGYCAGFCELDRAAEWLTLVPHPLSFEGSRRWRFRKEVEVIGTITAFSIRRAA